MQLTTKQRRLLIKLLDAMINDVVWATNVEKIELLNIKNEICSESMKTVVGHGEENVPAFGMCSGSCSSSRS